jgi:ATP-dependent DNA ligase
MKYFGANSYDNKQMIVDVPLQQIEPQVARGKFDESLWTNSLYIAEEKLDGERFKMHVFNIGCRFDSRTISKKTNRFTEKTGNVPHLSSFNIPGLNGTIFDGEIKFGDDSMSTSTIMGCLPEEAVKRQEEAGKWVSYYIFDIIFHNDEDMRDKPYYYRRRLIKYLFDRYLSANKHFKLTKLEEVNKKKFCDDIFAAGGEGVILKHIDAPYTDKKGWIKVKAVATFDVVVMGYEEATPETIKKGDDKATISRLAANGWIGALVFGQYVDEKLKKFGRCSGMPDDIRADFSNNKQARLGTVITIEAQSRIPKTGYFRHPRFLQLRPDKNANQCTYWEDES